MRHAQTPLLHPIPPLWPARQGPWQPKQRRLNTCIWTLLTPSSQLWWRPWESLLALMCTFLKDLSLTRTFLKDLGRHPYRPQVRSHLSYLVQRVSVAVQMGNDTFVMGTTGSFWSNLSLLFPLFYIFKCLAVIAIYILFCCCFMGL